MYIFKFEEFVAMLKKEYPRIHPKGIHVPKKYYEWYIDSKQNHPSNNHFYARAYIGNTSWCLRSTWALSEELWVNYKNKKHHFPISVLFESEYDNRLNKLIEGGEPQ